jgi:hypothetical protein
VVAQSHGILYTLLSGHPLLSGIRGYEGYGMSWMRHSALDGGYGKFGGAGHIGSPLAYEKSTKVFNR